MSDGKPKFVGLHLEQVHTLLSTAKDEDHWPKGKTLLRIKIRARTVRGSRSGQGLYEDQDQDKNYTYEEEDHKKAEGRSR